MTNEEWRQIFTKQLQEAESRLRDAKAMRWKIFERTASGERDVTNEHIAWLQSAVDEYCRILE